MKNPICDMHIHTKHSCDSVTSLEDYCLEAIHRGFHAICFTDHVDHNPHDVGYGYYDAKAFFEDFQYVKDKYQSKIMVLSGIEFADPHTYPDALRAYLSLDYDFVLGTVHFWYKDMYPTHMLEIGVPASVCYDRYWNEVLKAVKAGGFDCLGHMDFPKRYYDGLLFDTGVISGIFAEMISKNISLEINTSSLRKNRTETMPDKALLSIYESCGGKYITLGSDAHEACELSAGFDYARGLIDYFGFTEVVYSNRTRSSV